MSIGALIFVAVVFVTLGVAFIAPTAMLVYEFHDVGWSTLATTYGHIFLYFPTFGIASLIALYLPAAVFVDMYWRHLPTGRIRLCFGFLVIAALAAYLSLSLPVTEMGGIWQIRPEALLRDVRAGGRPCAGGQDCEPLPLLKALDLLRGISQQRSSIRPFARPCTSDPAVETDPGAAAKRKCFATDTMLDAAGCCRAQAALAARERQLLHAPGGRSLTSQLQEIAWPLQLFYFAMILLIGVLLAAWGHRLDRHYLRYAQRTERNMLISAVALLFYPLALHTSSYAVSTFMPSSGAYAGARNVGLLVGAWFLLLVLFFFRRHSRQVLELARTAALLATAIVALSYDTLIDRAIQLIGPGSGPLATSSFITISAGLLLLSAVGLRHTRFADSGSGIEVSELRPSDIASAIAAGSPAPTPPAAPAAADTAKPRSRLPRQAPRAIFLSYRRDDSADVTGRIYDGLCSRFGQQEVFKDVDAIPLGVDFRDYLREELAGCAVFIAVIGPDWLDIREKTGGRRLDNPADHVRIEIETALEREVPFIPILVRGAEMPSPDHLPPSIARLVYKNGLSVRRDPDFNRDMGRLAAGLALHIEAARGAAATHP